MPKIKINPAKLGNKKNINGITKLLNYSQNSNSHTLE